MIVCRHCDREIVRDENDDQNWIDERATGDDAAWRDYCDANDDEREAPHEPLWMIVTWMGRRTFDDETFASFEEARARISDYADTQTSDEDEYDGICSDLYAEPLES